MNLESENPQSRDQRAESASGRDPGEDPGIVSGKLKSLSNWTSAKDKPHWTGNLAPLGLSSVYSLYKLLT